MHTKCAPLSLSVCLSVYDGIMHMLLSFNHLQEDKRTRREEYAAYVAKSGSTQKMNVVALVTIILSVTKNEVRSLMYVSFYYISFLLLLLPLIRPLNHYHSVWSRCDPTCEPTQGEAQSSQEQMSL